MKKLVALLLALVMCVGLVACGANKTPGTDETNPPSTNTATPDNTDPGNNVPQPRPIVIGYPQAPVENSIISAMKLNRTAVAEACGGSLITEVFDFTPEGTVDAVEKMIQSGVDGLFVTPFAESIMPTISQMCEENGVYFIVSMRTVNDPDIKELLYANPYFLGCVYEADYNAGYALGKAFAEAGGKEYALIGTTVGDTTGDAREAGLAAAAEEFGLTQVAEVRAYAQASDATAAIESFMASYPELDGVIRVASTAAGDVNAIGTAIEAAGKGGEFIFCTNDVEDGSDEYFARGTITATLGDALVNDSALCAAILCNAILGTPLSDEPVDICLSFPIFTSVEDLQMQSEYVACETPMYSQEELRSEFLKYFNSDVTLDSVLELAYSFSPAAIAARRG